MSDMTYSYNAEDLSSFDYNDEVWQTGTSSSSSDMYTPVVWPNTVGNDQFAGTRPTKDQSDAMTRWANSCQSIMPFDYEAWQVERTFS